MAASSPELAAAPELRRGARVRDHALLAYAGRRLLEGLATLLIASFVIFAAVQLLPGDVVSAILGRNGTPQAVAQLTKDLHLDDPFLTRYWNWLTGVLSGDLGHPSASVVQGDLTTTVWQVIHRPLVNSLVLALVTFVVLVPISFLCGVLAAIRVARPTDRVISSVALVFNSLPEFLTGTIFIVIFFNVLGWFPPISAIPPGESPLSHPNALVLPVLTLLLVALASAVRMIRAATIEVLQANYVGMARLNGLTERRVLARYVVRNSLAPTVQVFAQIAQYLLGGIIVVESVFAYPGIGTTLVQAVSVRDVQVIAAVALILATVYIAINIVADLLVVVLVPKLRTGHR